MEKNETSTAIILTLLARQTKINICANSVDPDKTARSVCHSVFFFFFFFFILDWNPIFASVNVRIQA